MPTINKMTEPTTEVVNVTGVHELHPQNFFKKLMALKLIILGTAETDDKLELRTKVASTGEVFAYAFTTELAALSVFPRAKYLAQPKGIVSGRRFFKQLREAKMGLYLNPGFEPPLILTPAEIKLICDHNDD